MFGHDGEFFLDNVSKNWIIGQKTPFLTTKGVILGNLGQNMPAEGPAVVLPEIQSYPEIALVMGTIF